MPRDAAALAWMANLGCLELHPHPVRAEDLDHPDELRVDLDPVPGVEWPQIVEVARVVHAGARRARPRRLAEDLGLARHPRQRAHRSRAGRSPRCGAPRWRSPARSSAARPTLATSKWWKEERHGVFLDYNQNAKDRTVASAYSVRPKPDARVSAPLTWDELDALRARRTSRCARCPRASPRIGDRHARHRRAARLARGAARAVGAPGGRGAGRRAVAAALREAGRASRRACSRRSASAAGARRPAAASPRKPLVEIGRARAQGGRAGRARALEGAAPRGGRAPRSRPTCWSTRCAGAPRTWTRVRVNLEHVPEELRPPQEPLDPDYDPWRGSARRPRRPSEPRRSADVPPAPFDERRPETRRSAGVGSQLVRISFPGPKAEDRTDDDRCFQLHATFDGRHAEDRRVRRDFRASSARSVQHRAPRHRRRQDVLIEIQFCGVCHSDIHQARGEWGNSTFPMVPGHEIVGRVAAGRRRGDEASRRATSSASAASSTPAASCAICNAGPRAVLREGRVPSPTTAPRWTARRRPTAATRRRSWSTERLRAADARRASTRAGAAPLLCAGITTYSPLRQLDGRARATRVGVVGLGGLGHMGVKLAAAMGAEVTVLSTVAGEGGRRASGSARMRLRRRRSDAAHVRRGSPGSFDLILDTVSAPHDLNALPAAAAARRHDGPASACPPSAAAVDAFALIVRRQAPGRLAHRRHRRDPGDARLLRASTSIVADIEVIPIQTGQRGLRAHDQERRALPLRDRQREPEAGLSASGPAALARASGLDAKISASSAGGVTSSWS